MEKKWNYIGVFLDPESQKELLNAVKIPAGWKPYAHHMTCIFNSNGDPDDNVFNYYKPLFGMDYALEIDAIGISDRAIAGRVCNIKTNNKISHVTIAVAPGAKPVESNQIVNWAVTKPLHLRGTIGYFVNGEIHYGTE